MNGIYALCGAILFAAFGLSVSFNGASLVAWALLAGGVSQFVAQDNGKYSWIIANALAYVGMIIAAAALVTA